MLQTPSINISKTCFMLYCSPNKTLLTFSNIYLNSKKIAFCSRANFLGIVVDSNKFNEHVISIVKKAAFSIRALIRARPYFNTQILLGLHFAFVHGHLNYCIASWGSSYATHCYPSLHYRNKLFVLSALHPVDHLPFHYFNSFGFCL